MLRIALTGPESTGKSTLSQYLAEHYCTAWVPEFARKYLEDRPAGLAYTLQDLEAIARGQIAAEEAAVQAALRCQRPLVFCDTELLVIKVWAEHAFGHCPDWILNELEQRCYDLILLMGVDLPWEPDPLREHPHQRQYFYELYRRELSNQLANYAEVSGSWPRRQEQARFLVNELLLSHGFEPRGEGVVGS